MTSKTTKTDGWYKELLIRFQDGQEEQFHIEMTRSGTFSIADFREPSDWAKLKFHQCACCPLNQKDMSFCPAAESLDNSLLRFKDRYSYEQVEAVAIDGANRSTHIKGTLQEVGSIFVQLSVFSSGCPIGKKLRPLLWDLRPFATNNELTHHLITKLVLKFRGDINLAKQDIHLHLDPLNEVFKNLWKRINDTCYDGDAVQNSIVRMDAFTINLLLKLDESLEELAKELDWDMSNISVGTFDGTETQPFNIPNQKLSLWEKIKFLFSK
ncbi:MAG: hypothetical protein MK193_01290 [Lentisphaeria bacterium]|nr:hypothetical protein [Lentisphaeria bacterium]